MKKASAHPYHVSPHPAEMYTNTSDKPPFKVVESSPKGRFLKVSCSQFNEKLGSGTYKQVYRGYDTEFGCEVAWSVINMRNLQKADRERILEEVRIGKRLVHRNIVNFICAWGNSETEELVMITELVSMTLLQYIKQIGQPKLNVIKRWCSEILEGIRYLHSQEPAVMHRDLKPENIFVMANSGEIRIGDFGLSSVVRSGFTHSCLGTPAYMAPEVYQGQYGALVDIYAFGMSLLEICTMQTPYNECINPAAIYSKVINGVLPKSLDMITDEEVKEFIKCCIQPVESRPSACSLLNHSFLIVREGDGRQPIQLIQDLSDKSQHSDCIFIQNTPQQSVEIELIIRRAQNTLQKVTFKFSVNVDTPEQVAAELISELELEDCYITTISQQIKEHLSRSCNISNQRTDSTSTCESEVNATNTARISWSDQKRMHWY